MKLRNCITAEVSLICVIFWGCQSVVNSHLSTGSITNNLSSQDKHLQQQANNYLAKNPAGLRCFTNEALYQCTLSEGLFNVYTQPVPEDMKGRILDGEYGAVYLTQQGLVYLFKFRSSGLWCDLVSVPTSDAEIQAAFQQIILKYGGHIEGLTEARPFPVYALIYTPRLISSIDGNSVMIFFAKNDPDRIFAIHYCGKIQGHYKIDDEWK